MQAIFAKRSGMIILGGGMVKHHIANANLMVSGVALGIRHARRGLQQWTRWVGIPSSVQLGWSEAGSQTARSDMHVIWQ